MLAELRNERVLRSVVVSGTRRDPSRRIHTGLEILPPLVRDLDVALLDLRRALGKDVEQNHETI